jgi:hypothetical protein
LSVVKRMPRISPSPYPLPSREGYIGGETAISHHFLPSREGYTVREAFISYLLTSRGYPKYLPLDGGGSLSYGEAGGGDS